MLMRLDITSAEPPLRIVTTTRRVEMDALQPGNGPRHRYRYRGKNIATPWEQTTINTVA
jgi:hypothetical protein